MAVMAELQSQAVTGVVSPSVGEAMIRDAWPSMAAGAAGATARKFYQSWIFAPIGWLILVPSFLMRLAGFVVPGFQGWVTRYRLTNRRLMLCTGYQAKCTKEVPLNKIKDVRLRDDEGSRYYFVGDLDVIGDNNEVLMTVASIREPESFRQAILQAVHAWGPLL